jgi:hypothetical protein
VADVGVGTGVGDDDGALGCRWRPLELPTDY